MGDTHLLLYLVGGYIGGWLLFYLGFLVWWCWQRLNVKVSVPNVYEWAVLRWYALRTWWMVRKEQR